MLRRLSWRNAKRQLKEYALFFVTLTCAVAALYAFHALIFSKTAKALPDLELLPYLIAASSLLIVLILGWVVSYMMSYMLKRRSKEFSIYMVCGISNRKISALLFQENSLIGLLAFGPGMLLGMLFSQILEAVLLSVFGLSYTLHFGFSLPAMGLTFLYFSAMLLYGGRRNGRWVRRVQLRELLSYDSQNEKAQVFGSRAATLVFLLSLLSAAAGFLLICIQPMGRGYDVLAGTILLILFLLGFFVSIPAFLVARLEERIFWKYKNHRLVPFRGFTTKINSIRIVMGMLSILFMLSIIFGGIGSTIGLMMTKNVSAGAFDLMILHPGEMGDFSRYDRMIRQGDLAEGYAYGIYTNGRRDFAAVHDQAVQDAGRKVSWAYAEQQYDACMALSDYQRLRDLLGYEQLELDPARCYVHCIPALEDGVRALVQGQEQLECAGYPFAENGVFTEPFSQQNDYGNGGGYVIIVPDRAVMQMQVVYSIYAAVTGQPLSPGDLQGIADACEGLIQLDRSSAKSTPNGAPTAFVKGDMDYLSGKWVDKAEFRYLYAILICLFYLALVLEITGAAILATQVLGDWQRRQRQDRILRQLGMEERLIARLNSRQLSQLFLLPLLPALVLSSSFVYICAKKILVSFFVLPIVPDIVWIGQAFGIGLGLFLLLYLVYYLAARISLASITSLSPVQPEKVYPA